MSEELSLDTRAEANATPDKAVRRWLLEIKLATKREKDFRAKAKEILEKYRGKNKKKNSFNILWANTEVLRPALYNSSPKPDVRRRFRQNDLLGKAVAEVAERSISYCVDAYDLDNCLKNDVLDALLPGRGLSRVRYVPKFKTSPAAQAAVAAKPASAAPSDTTPAPAGGSRINNGIYQKGAGSISAQNDPTLAGEAFEGNREEVEYEQALCDHVQWDDFLHGPGKTWEEVQWTGFKCRLSKDDQIEKFGKEIADKVTLDDVDDAEISGDERNADLKEVFKKATFWEIWDKEGEKVFFVNESYKEGVIYPEGEDGTPPLKLKNFFPCPRPLMLVEDTGSLIPIALYELYREQAEELDRLSTRINKVVGALKVRGVYDSTLAELSELMKGEDNTLVAASQARAWMTNGGLEKAIWWMPVQQSAVVLKELYAAREIAKQVIYEITGISDIIRGVTNPHETLGAQQLKANSSSLRLQRMQREVQRYVRDLIRLLAEVIGENFDPQTLSQMTGLQFPTAVQKQQLQVLLQGAQQAAQGGQQLPPEVQQKIQHAQEQLKAPTWEDVMGVLRSDMQREYRVDVETDSTVAQSLQQDMEGLKEVLTGLVEFWQGVMLPVQSGALSIEAVKSISMTIVRRARFGLEVEDALESGMQQPKQQDNGEAQKAEVEKQKLQQQQQADQAKQAHEQQAEQARLAHEQQVAQQNAQLEERRIQLEAAAKEREMQMQAAFDRQQQMMDAEFQRFKALLEAKTKVDVAEIGAEASVKAAKEKPAPAKAEA